MPLERQIIEVPIVGGVDESADALAKVRATTIENYVERKDGALVKRNGYIVESKKNRIPSGIEATVIPQDPVLLTTAGDTLLRVSADGRIYVYNASDADQDWYPRGRVSDASVVAVPIASTRGEGEVAGITAESSCVVVGDYVVTGYCITGSDDTGVSYDVRRVSTGALVASGIIESGAYPAETISDVRVAAMGNEALIAWSYLPDWTVRGVSFNTVLASLGTVNELVTLGEPGKFDVTSNGSSWIVAYVDGSAQMMLESFDLDLQSELQLVVDTSVSSVVSVSVRGNTAFYNWVAWTTSNGGSYSVRAATANYDLSAPGSAGSVASGTGYECPIVAITPTDVEAATVTWTQRYVGTRWASIDYTVAVTLAPQDLPNAYLISRPCKIGADRLFAWVQPVHSSHGTPVLVDLGIDTALPSGVSPRIVAVALPRQLRPLRSTDSPWLWLSVGRHGASHALYSSGEEMRVAIDTVRDDGTVAIWHMVATVDSDERSVAEVGGELYFAGGAPHAWDGTSAYEIGFVHEPDAYAAAAPVSGGTGGMTNAATYGYVTVYSCVDAMGVRSESAPSISRSVTLTGADTAATVALPWLYLSNRFRDDSALKNSVRVDIYRTLADGSVYYYVASVQNSPSAGGTYFDDASDDDISVNRTLYTDSGEIANTVPPSATSVLSWRGSLVLAGTDDGSVYFSKPISGGTAPGFSGALTQAPWTGGPVVGLADIDGVLVVGKARTLWRIDGEPPSALGASSLTTPSQIPARVGMSSQTGTLRIPDGVAFASTEGISLLDRSFAVSHIGVSIKDTVPAGTRFAGVLITDDGYARWYLKDSSTVAVLDLPHTAMRQSPAWTIDILSDPTAEPYTAGVLGATLWRGVATWIGGIAVDGARGKLLTENAESSADTDFFGTSPYHPSGRIVLAYEQAAGKHGAHRMIRASILAGATAGGASFDVNLTLAGDYGSTIANFSAQELDDATAGQDWMSISVGPGTTPGAGKGSAFRLEYTDSPHQGGSVTGGGLEIKGVAFEVALMPGLRTRRVGSRK